MYAGTLRTIIYNANTNMILRLRSLFAALAVVLLIGCEPYHPHGTITDKEFRPAHDETFLMPRYDFFHEEWSLVEETIRVPDKWVVTVKDADRTSDVYVTKDRYDKVAVGELWGFEETD